MSTFDPSLRLGKARADGRLRKTLGGRQFWTDYYLHDDWRIQRHCRSERFRLLDDADRRRCQGSFAECLEHFERIAREESLPPMQPTVVVLLHGLGDVRRVMRHFVRRFRSIDGYSAVSMNYASTRKPLADHAGALASVVDHLPPTTQTIHFVGYSMGSIVVRHFFGDRQRSGEPLSNLGRVVMIGSPNNGASIAAALGRKNPIFRAILGQSAVQLGTGWGTIQERLAVPPCEFGILAGNSASVFGGNPLIAGRNDWIVAVQETKLAGAADFREFPIVHALMPRSPRVIDCVERFLAHGYFESADTRQPLTESLGE